MQWVLDNWIWILLGGGMIAMHLFGHGGHGSQGGRSGHRESSSGASQTEPASQTIPATSRDKAIHILLERFARGEIDIDEFEERKRLLSD